MKREFPIKNLPIFRRLIPFLILGCCCFMLSFQDAQAQIYYWREITDEEEKSVTREVLDEGDEDGDGIRNVEDWCINAAGAKTNHGCPDGKVDQAEKFDGGDFANFFPFADQDGDGVANTLDYCKAVPGLLEFYGCPTENLMKVSKLNAEYLHPATELTFPDSQSFSIRRNERRIKVICPKYQRRPIHDAYLHVDDGRYSGRIYARFHFKGLSINTGR